MSVTQPALLPRPPVITIVPGTPPPDPPVDPEPPILLDLFFSAQSVEGGTSLTGTVSLSLPATAGGITIGLLSETPGVSVPSQVVVPEGDQEVSFPIVTSVVTVETEASILASDGTNTVTKTFTVTPVTPPPPPPEDTTPPSTPGTPTATNITQVSATVSWSGSTDNVGVVGYGVYQNGALVQTVSGLSATLVGLACEQTYTIQIDAVDAAGNRSTKSGALSLTTLDCDEPPPPPPPDPPEVQSLVLSATSVAGGSPVQGVVTLTKAALPGGQVVQLASSHAAAQVPASVTVLAGDTTAAFSVSTSSVSQDVLVTITGTANGTAKSDTVTVLAPPPPPPVGPTPASLTLSPSTLIGGNGSTGTVTLTAAAPAGGVVVTLQSSNTNRAIVPASITIPFNQISGTFPITTTLPSNTVSVIITATANGAIKQAILTITPEVTDPGPTPIKRPPRDIAAIHARDEAIMNALIPAGAATVIAVASGNWESPGTWSTGAVPTAADRVRIPSGLTVTITTQTAVCAWLRLEGTVFFSRGASTRLSCDTIYGATHDATLDMGTDASPIPLGVTAEIVFVAASTSFNHATDPFEAGRGLVTMGPLKMRGATKDAYKAVVGTYAAGATVITLASAPSGWQVGDTVVLTSGVWGEDETRIIQNVSGAQVTLTQGLSFAKTKPAAIAGLSWVVFHLANLTRNVIIRSAVAGVATENTPGTMLQQGHVMLMHGGHTLKYAAFINTGRTDLRPPTDPTIKTDGTRDPQLYPNCLNNAQKLNGVQLENVRGRYPLHFHLNKPDGPQSVVEFCVCRSTARNSRQRWGIISHSSNVAVRWCVVHQIDGAQYVTEEGDEVGVWEDNLAIYAKGNDTPFAGQPGSPSCMSQNYPEIQKYRRLTLAHTGVGFWVEGGGVVLRRNIASGHTQGLNANTAALDQQGEFTFRVDFLSHLFWGDFSWTNGDPSLPVTDIPTNIVDSLLYAGRRTNQSKEAAVFYNVHQNHTIESYPNVPHSVHEGTRAWNYRKGFLSEYTSQLDVNDVHMEAGSAQGVASSQAMAIGAQGGRHHIVRNSQFNGYTDKVLRLGQESSACDNVTTDGVTATALIGGVQVACS